MCRSVSHGDSHHTIHSHPHLRNRRRVRGNRRARAQSLRELISGNRGRPIRKPLVDDLTRILLHHQGLLHAMASVLSVDGTHQDK